MKPAKKKTAQHSPIRNFVIFEPRFFNIVSLDNLSRIYTDVQKIVSIEEFLPIVLRKEESSRRLTATTRFISVYKWIKGDKMEYKVEYNADGTRLNTRSQYTHEELNRK